MAKDLAGEFFVTPENKEVTEPGGRFSFQSANRASQAGSQSKKGMIS
jgi:hypothetical protein